MIIICKGVRMKGEFSTFKFEWDLSFLFTKSQVGYLESKYKIVTVITLYRDAVCDECGKWLVERYFIIYLWSEFNTQESTSLSRNTTNRCDYGREGRHMITRLLVNIYLTQIYQSMFQSFTRLVRMSPRCNEPFQLSTHEIKFCAMVDKLYDFFFLHRDIVL